MVSETLLKIPASVIGNFFPLSVPHRMLWKCAKILSVVLIFQDHRRLPVIISMVKTDSVGSLKRVSERVFSASSESNYLIL
jgi:hypothetical protein